MSILAELKEWGAAVALVSPLVSAALLWWLSQRFASRKELEAVHVRLDGMDDRLDEGAQRFQTMDAAIREATHAAEDAKEAAERAIKAAEEIGDARLEVAELRGDIKTLNALLVRLERDSARMVDGHLAMGGKV